MNATDPFFANVLQTAGTIEHYHVPKYQREYTWGKNEWEQLLTDIDENDPGYFMGSIICIDDNSELGPGESRVYEVVDGQQRLTTLSILLMAIYAFYLELLPEMEESGDEDEMEEVRLIISNIKKRILIKKNSINKGENYSFKEKDKYCFLRLQPSTQKNNFADYLHILEELDLIKGKFTSKFCGNRRIYKAYSYFYDHLPEGVKELNELLHKIESLKFIHISVASSSDAFTLFESLNNRGIPLSVMDIIKNKMLASMEKNHEKSIDESYEDWQELLTYLPEFPEQERFLRHYYNAFKVYPEKKIEKINRATKSTLIKIYEQYIKNDAQGIFADLIEKAKIYNRFIQPEDFEEANQAKLLLELKRVGSTPSQLLLLYLYNLETVQFVNWQTDIKEVLSFLVKYYVRRNITDFPNTRDLDAINIEVIEECQKRIDRGEKLDSEFIVNTILNGRGKPSSIETFKEHLEDNLFAYNSGMARYVLVKLDEMSHSREYKPDLWARNDKGLLVWTVEHVFPQGLNIPNEWVEMLAEGNKMKASEIQDELVHCLGNLTLSGYNSQLSNASFENKQGLHEDRKILGHKINIGYQNGLSINNLEFQIGGVDKKLATIEVWNREAIIARNEQMVEILLRMFSFEE